MSSAGSALTSSAQNFQNVNAQPTNSVQKKYLKNTGRNTKYERKELKADQEAGAKSSVETGGKGRRRLLHQRRTVCKKLRQQSHYQTRAYQMRVESIIQREIVLMFAEMTKKYVKAAVGAETQKAVENWGLKYASLHEGYAVLKEEVEESDEELNVVKVGLDVVWDAIRGNDRYTTEEMITHVQSEKEHAEQLALEACQIAAVCNKILNGLKNEG